MVKGVILDNNNMYFYFNYFENKIMITFVFIYVYTIDLFIDITTVKCKILKSPYNNNNVLTCNKWNNEITRHFIFLSLKNYTHNS